MVSPVMQFGGGKSRIQAQHHTLERLRPGRLSMEPRWSGAVTDAKIRVYADDEYRAQNRKWRAVFEERLDYANAVLAAEVGVRLVAEYHEWDHHAPGARLVEQLEALQRLDPGTDVLVVVGLTSSVSLVTSTFEELGAATMPGRHMMLRGYADHEERRAFANAFADLTADERESALVTMRFHKTTAAFLHELGHVLGADHESGPDTLMSPIYSREMTAFSEHARATILRALDERLGRVGPAAPPDAPPPAPRASHEKMTVIMVVGGAIVDGVPRSDADLDLLFRLQAAIDSRTEVTIRKTRDITSAMLAKLVDRARAAGLTRIQFK